MTVPLTLPSTRVWAGGESSVTTNKGLAALADKTNKELNRQSRVTLAAGEKRVREKRLFIQGLKTAICD
ncbi:hypothetical protein GCM10027098_07760 [Bowmanella dokdonensis]